MTTNSVLQSTNSIPGDRVAAVRRFSRFYTNVLGLLQEGLLETEFSLTEARVIFELAASGPADAASLRRRLDIDPGYLSRLLARLGSAGLISRQRDPDDGRRQLIELTAQGQAAFATLNARSDHQVRDLLTALPEPAQRRLTGAMAAIEEILSGPAGRQKPAAYLLRSPGPGDLGWMVKAHGELYAQEYGWDTTFEALVARIVADYADNHDPSREAAWIADVDGQPVGCVLCVRKDDDTAQLRILLVDPAARGLGIGARLVGECLTFARRAGYKRIVLWTNDVLTAARRIYQAAGFRLTGEEPHHSFGHDLVSQTWQLDF
ncbi:MAG TPA: helix-turn-helix domain-containing GNAT family N-acetyltransferase [Streptosporangiaceae bacterium]|nr:helix-turn-helix domain-containing GNAT family N-acetyltransferase [Streptosporangiaceae bacterium]